MAMKHFKPYTPSRRNMTVSDFSEVTKKTPEKSLLAKKRKNAGRNSYGRITVRHQGGGNRQKYRIIDFKRNKVDMPATVIGIEYDPNRSANIALIQYENGEKNVLEESSQQKRYIKNNLLGKVYQNPILGLKMDFSCIGNIAEKLIAANNRNVKNMTNIAEELLKKVNIPLFRMYEAPKNFSGGMQQRVQIAKALSNNPPILLLDEVTTGLDLSVQANVLDLIKMLQRERGISMIVVSHDLGVIKMLCDRTIVMLNGKIVEEGLTDQILEDPQHEYTQQLVQSLL